LCFVAVSYLKNALGYDDALDAFGVHAVGGTIGAILTGVFVNPALGGVGVYENWFTMKLGYDVVQIWIQVKAVIVAFVWSAIVSIIALMIIKSTIGLRVSSEAETEGLDIAEHGEKAYNP
jgi:Amt family ammonium transporter